MFCIPDPSEVFAASNPRPSSQTSKVSWPSLPDERALFVGPPLASPWTGEYTVPALSAGTHLVATEELPVMTFDTLVVS